MVFKGIRPFACADAPLIRKREKEVFSVGEKIVYPMHGAGVIDSIETKEVGGKSIDYYKVKIVSGNIMLMIPVNNTSGVQLRHVISKEQAENVLETFGSSEDLSDIPWNKRYKTNIDRLKTGTIENVSAVLCELIYREKTHGLSTSDRKMFILTKSIFCSELSSALDIPSADIFERILSKV